MSRHKAAVLVGSQPSIRRPPAAASNPVVAPAAAAQAQVPAPQGQQSARERAIEQRLELLLHANGCERREAEARETGATPPPCTRLHCQTMRGVLLHVKTCESGTRCFHPHCQSSLQIMKHWNQCRNSNCYCSTLKARALSLAQREPEPGMAPPPLSLNAEE